MPNLITHESALQLIPNANRILVIGCSGGGKSTLAQHLSDRWNLSYISLDRDVRWLPGWNVRDARERLSIVQQFVSDERWIMDGTYPSTFNIRLARTDLVLWVRVPTYVALFSVYRRAITHYGKTRPDMAPGCVERLPDREFLSYIWNFEKATAPVILNNLDQHGPEVPVLILRSRKAINALLQGQPLQ